MPGLLLTRAQGQRLRCRRMHDGDDNNDSVVANVLTTTTPASTTTLPDIGWRCPLSLHRPHAQKASRGHACTGTKG
jgi:hypothetical protein